MLITMLAAAVAAAVIAGDSRAEHPRDQVAAATDQIALAADLSQLRYQIVTRSGSDAASCEGATPRTTMGTVGVPTLVSVGGGILPDTAVTLAVVPGTGGTTHVDLSVARLRPTHTRSGLEVVVMPEAGSSERVSFGYDGCEAGAPAGFNETITTAPGRLNLATREVQLTPALTLLAGEFTVGPDGTRTDSRLVSARLAPMPPSAAASVVTTAPDSYRATVRTRPGTNVQVHHAQFATDGGTSIMDAEIGHFPGELDLQLTPTLIDYVATGPLEQPLSEPIDLVDVATVTTSPGDPEERLRARLEQVPATGRLERVSDTRVELTAPQGPIGVASVSYASIPEGTTPPALNPVGDQYLVARKTHDLLVAEVRVEGLSHAVVDAGDPAAGADPATDDQTDKIPTVVEVTHHAGPFTIDAAVTSRREMSPVDVTRTAVARVVDLPATARVEFGATTQSFSYQGSDEIGLLSADVTSTEPFVDDATAAHLRIMDFPTGLVGRFDEDGKQFTARVPDGEVGSIDLLVTNGPDAALPIGVDGLRLEDHDGQYAAAARISGLRRIAVGWGATRFVEVAHSAGRFELHTHTTDPDASEDGESRVDIRADLVVDELPSIASFEYSPSRKVEPECVDAPDQPCARTPLELAFSGDAAVRLATFDTVDSLSPIIVSPNNGNVGAREAHVVLKNIPATPDIQPDVHPLPPGMTLSVDGDQKQMDATVNGDVAGFVVELEACSPQVCGTVIDTGKLPPEHPATLDGLWLTDHTASYHLFSRISGLSGLTLGWGDTVVVQATKRAGPFDIVVDEEKTYESDDRLPLLPLVYGSRTSVAVRDLPSHIDLAYDKQQHSVDYNEGSSDIGSIEAWHSVDPIKAAEVGKVVNALAGRATEAHLKVLGLPSGTHLVAQFGDAADKLVLNTGGPTIGRIELELMSDPALADPVAQSRLVSWGYDGVELWDLDDFDNIALEGFDDAYVIVARVTNLRSLRYEKLTEESPAPSNDKTEETALDLERDGATNLWVNTLKAEEADAPRTIPGFPEAYRAQALELEFEGPPARSGLWMRDSEDTVNGFRRIELKYWGSADGDQMSFFTNAGTGFTHFTLQGVPGGAGTLTSPGIDTCLAPNNYSCSPKPQPKNSQKKLSLSAAFASPVLLSGAIHTDESQTFFKDVHIERGITAAKVQNDAGINSTHVYVDTMGGMVSGLIYQVKDGDTAMKLDLPPGTYADQRYVDVETEGVGFSHGSMGCPFGIVLEVESVGIDVDVTDDLCTGALIDTVVRTDTGHPAVVAPGETVHLTIRGSSFVDGWMEADGTIHRGTWVYPRDPVPGLVDAIMVLDIRPNEIDIVLHVSADAAEGTYVRLGVNNPVKDPNVDWCDDCVVVGAPAQ